MENKNEFVRSSAREYGEALLVFGSKIGNYCWVKRYQTGGSCYVTRKGYFITREGRELLVRAKLAN